MKELFTNGNNDPHYVYILKCSSGNYYVGCTNNLEKRLKCHQNGKVKSTEYRLPVELVTYIAFDKVLTTQHNTYSNIEISAT